MIKKAIRCTSTEKASEEDERKRGEEKVNLFKNRFRGGDRKARGEC